MNPNWHIYDSKPKYHDSSIYSLRCQHQCLFRYLSAFVYISRIDKFEPLRFTVWATHRSEINLSVCASVYFTFDCVLCLLSVCSFLFYWKNMHRYIFLSVCENDEWKNYTKNRIQHSHTAIYSSGQNKQPKISIVVATHIKMSAVPHCVLVFAQPASGKIIIHISVRSNKIALRVCFVCFFFGKSNLFAVDLESVRVCDSHSARIFDNNFWSYFYYSLSSFFTRNIHACRKHMRM